MSKPTLSVIMGNYNHAQYIGEALESILAQSFRPQEVVVIDDGSTDNSIQVIEAFTKRDSIVHLLRNERNMGVVPTVNRGLEHATGDYIYSAAADDRILPGLFEISMKLLAKYPQAGLCCSDPAYFDERTSAISEIQLFLSDKPTYFTPTEWFELIRRKRAWVAGHTSVVKRAALLEAGGMLPELRWHCDWFALLVISFRYGVCYIPESLAVMRISPSSYSASGGRQWAAQKRVLIYLLHLLKSPGYRDVLLLFQQSGIMSCFCSKILRVLLSKPEHWDYLSPLLIARVLWNEALGWVARNAPSSLKHIYRSVRDKRRQNKRMKQK